MEEKASGMAIASVVLSVLGCLGCGGCVFGLIGAILGKMELGKIDSGESSEAGRGMAKGGLILGIINVVLYGLAIIVYVCLMALGMFAGM